MSSLTLIHAASLPSTNTELIKLAEKGGEHGTVLWVDEQTKGRGQFDRKWLSEKGKDALFSVLLRPSIVPAEAPQITKKVAEILIPIFVDKLDCLKEELSIKEPNDILLRGKKVCGILTESRTCSEKLEFVIIGIGININSKPSSSIEDAISFYEVSGNEIEVLPVIRCVCEEIVKEFS